MHAYIHTHIYTCTCIHQRREGLKRAAAQQLTHAPRHRQRLIRSMQDVSEERHVRKKRVDGVGPEAEHLPALHQQLLARAHLGVACMRVDAADMHASRHAWRHACKHTYILPDRLKKMQQFQQTKACRTDRALTPRDRSMNKCVLVS